MLRLTDEQREGYAIEPALELLSRALQHNEDGEKEKAHMVGDEALIALLTELSNELEIFPFRHDILEFVEKWKLLGKWYS